MCKLVEDYAAEKLRQAEIQTASNFLKNGVSVDIVAKSIPSLTREFIVELSKKILQPSNIQWFRQPKLSVGLNCLISRAGSRPARLMEVWSVKLVPADSGKGLLGWVLFLVAVFNLIFTNDQIILEKKIIKGGFCHEWKKEI